MGFGGTTPAGAPAPRPTVYDIDGFDNPASTVAALHHAGDRVICYVEVGAVESYRPDSSRFPVSALGDDVPGYPDERYLDVTASTVLPIVESRIAMCKLKGFDAVEPDIDDSYSDRTGFPITEEANIAYDRALGEYAHTLGVAWGQKNGDADGVFSQSLEPVSDFVIDEQCFEYGTCATVATPYLKAGKAVFEVEYSLPKSQFCSMANSEGFNSLLLDPSLAGSRQPCR